MIIDGDRILAAGCYLPLTEDAELSRWLGTRHRAAIGVTEVSDAVSLIVSEERGEISLAINGRISRDLKEQQLRKYPYIQVKSEVLDSHSPTPALADLHNLLKL